MKIIIVLSNEFDESLEINLITRLRANFISKIYKTGDIIITLGWNGGLKTKSISHKVKDYIINHLGVSDESIISIPDSRDTVGDAFFSREFIEKKEFNNYDVHVITSNYHIKRVKYIFQTCFLETKIIFHGVETPCQGSEKEDKSLEKFKKTFYCVDFSNLESFRKILLSKHLMYKK